MSYMLLAALGVISFICSLIPTGLDAKTNSETEEIAGIAEQHPKIRIITVACMSFDLIN